MLKGLYYLIQKRYDRFVSSLWKTNDYHLSFFLDHLYTISKQEGISFRKAAIEVYKMGYRGIDVWTSIDESKLEILDNIGFEHSCAVTRIELAEGEKIEEQEDAIEFAVRHNYERLLLVPGRIPDENRDLVFPMVISRIKQFAERAYKRGIDVMIEDCEFSYSPCYGITAIRKILNECPSLNFTFDSGNFIYCGVDDMQALKEFYPKVHHIHLKDRTKPHDMATTSIGAGIMSLQSIINYLYDNKYNGWLTIENERVPDMLERARMSFDVVKNAIDKSKRTHEQRD